MFNILNKSKFKAWFFIREAGTYKFKKRKKFKPNPKKPLIKYKGKNYDVNLDNPSFRKGLTSHFFLEFEGKQIITSEVENNDTAIKELLYMDEAIKQTFIALKPPKLYLNWIHLVLAIGFSLLVGWILGSFIPIGINGVG